MWVDWTDVTRQSNLAWRRSDRHTHIQRTKSWHLSPTRMSSLAFNAQHHYCIVDAIYGSSRTTAKVILLLLNDSTPAGVCLFVCLIFLLDFWLRTESGSRYSQAIACFDPILLWAHFFLLFLLVWCLSGKTRRSIHGSFELHPFCCEVNLSRLCHHVLLYY